MSVNKGGGLVMQVIFKINPAGSCKILYKIHAEMVYHLLIFQNVIVGASASGL